MCLQLLDAISANHSYYPAEAYFSGQFRNLKYTKPWNTHHRTRTQIQFPIQATQNLREIRVSIPNSCLLCAYHKYSAQTQRELNAVIASRTHNGLGHIYSRFLRAALECLSIAHFQRTSKHDSRCHEESQGTLVLEPNRTLWRKCTHSQKHTYLLSTLFVFGKYVCVWVWQRAKLYSAVIKLYFI